MPPRQTARGAFPDQLVPAQTPYERLPRTLAGYTWWRLALAALIAVAVWAVGQMVIIVPTMFTGTDPFELQDRLLNLDALDVPILLVALGSLAILIPAIWFGMWVMRLRPAWVVSSVVGRLRWRWMLRCGLYAVATLLVSLGAGLLVELGSGVSVDPVWTPWSRLWLPLLVILLVVPFQAAAEEYAFRGIMVQAIGSWLPRRWWTRIVVVLVTTGLFVSGHMYELWGLLDVGIFGLGALWVTLRTGGLEAAIALHVVNNVTVFAMLASGVWGTTTQATDGGSLIGVIISAITTIGYCAAVELTARRWQLQRTSPWPEVGSTQAPDVPMPEARVLGAAELAGVGTVAGAEVGVGAGGTAGAGAGAGAPVYPPDSRE